MLSDQEKTEMSRYFNKIALAQELEVSVVITDFEAALETALLAPKVKNGSRRAQIKRARSILNTNYDNRAQAGDPYVFWLYGNIGNVKDWNADLFDHNDAELGRGNMDGLLAEGRVMTLNGKPVSTIESSVKSTVYIDPSSNEVFKEPGEGLEEHKAYTTVTKGTLWKKGLTPIWRDHRVSSNGRLNFNYSKQLGNRWEMTMVGMGYPEDIPKDIRLIEIKVKWAQADPKDKKFFFKKFKCFQPYVANFTIDENKTSAWRYVLKTNSLTPRATDATFKDGIEVAIEDLIYDLNKKHGKNIAKAKIGKVFDLLPDFLEGYSDVVEYHSGLLDDEESDMFDGAVIHKPDGSIKKSPAGWDSVKWNKYAIMAVDVSAVNLPTSPTGSYSYSLSDASIKKPMRAWAGREIFTQPHVPGRCIMMIKTGRKPTRYDRATKTQIPDSKNGDMSITAISIASINSSESKIEEPEIGDL